MAKCELIDRNGLEITPLTTDYYGGKKVIAAVLMEDIDKAPIIPKQEIVRHYLTKIRAEIISSIEDIKGTYDNTTPEHDRSLCKCARNEVRLEIIDMIDNIIIRTGDMDMRYEDIKILLKNFLMNQYDIRPSLAEKTVDEMFRKATEYISLEEQRSKNEL